MLTERFADALSYATRLHAAQARKGTTIPYVSHLLSVTALVLEADGDEDEAIAALLHDAAEDQGGRERLTEIRAKFGPAVAAIVEGCSDTLEEPKPEWWERKQKYLAHLPEAAGSVLLVSVADKLHNARCILADYRDVGEALWTRFRAGKKGTLWYYSNLVKAYQASNRVPQKLLAELRRVVDELLVLAGTLA